MFSFKTPHILAIATLALIASAPHVARAQPDPNNAAKADNPDNRKRETREERNDRRREERAEQRKRQMIRQLERVGVTEDAQQEAIVEYIDGETEAREELQQSSRALATAMRTEAVNDTEVATLLNNYNIAIEDDRLRRKTAQKKLNETINLLEVPRLEAFLTLMGIYGDAPAVGNNWRGRGR